MSRYLITGGAGFIGSNLARRLVDLSEEVIILDNFSSGKRENLQDIRNDVEVIEGDICDLEAVRRAVRGVRYVLHHAAVVSVTRSVEDPVRTNAVNVNGTLNCLMAAREAKVERFIFAGSSSAYGDNPDLPKREVAKPEPLSPYAVSKLVGEMYCQVFYQVYGLRTVSLRYFNIFGPYQDPDSPYAAVIPIFITRLLRGERPVVYGDGSQSRDFTYIDNAVQANLLALSSQAACGQVINVACGERFTLNDLLARLGRLTRTEIEAIYAAPRPGDVKHSQGDVSTAYSLLQYRPLITFEEGLHRTVDWFRKVLSAPTS